MAKIDELLKMMADLRDGERGCPWDRAQTYETIAPYTIEEAYEVADALLRGDMHEFREELGDLLFQVIFQSQIAKERGDFDFYQVMQTLLDKMIERHPHVFGDEKISSIEEQNQRWEEIKALKSKSKSSVLDDIPNNIPPLLKADKIQKKAAKVGFDWPNIEGVLTKIEEELQEVKDEINNGNDSALEEELGDLLFSCINLVRFAKLSPDVVLAKANIKFENRFRTMEDSIQKQGKNLQEMDIQALEKYWIAVKNNGKSK